MNIATLNRWYYRQPSSRRLFWFLVFTFSAVILVSSVSLFFQFRDVRSIETTFSQQFWEKNNQFSLQEIAKQTARLLQIAMDSQSNFLFQIKNCLLEIDDANYQSQGAFIRPTDSFVQKNYSEPGVYFTKNDSQFQSTLHSAVDYLLGVLTSSISETRFRRINVVYQSLNDSQDIMVKTLPGTKDFIIRNITLMEQRFNLSKQNFMTVNGPYRDPFSASTSAQLISIGTKVAFAEYVVLIQMEIFAYITNRVLARVKYEESANVIFLAVDYDAPNGLLTIGNSYSLEPDVDYRTLLSPGFHEVDLHGRPFYAYTQPLSTEYQYGNANGKQLGDDGELRLMITSVGAFMDINNKITDFVQKAYEKKIQFLIIFIFLLSPILLGLVFYMVTHVSLSINFITRSIIQYCLAPQASRKLASSLSMRAYSSKWAKFQELLVKTQMVMRRISTRIRKNQKNNVVTLSKQFYPSNLLEQNFQHRNQLSDLSYLRELRSRLAAAAAEQQISTQASLKPETD